MIRITQCSWNNRGHLVIDRPRMLALWTFIKDGLTFINRSQLDCIITHFWMSALYTGLFNCCSHRFRRFLESCLLFIALGPQRNCPIRRISGRRWQRWHFREIGSIGTYVAFNGSIGIDLKGRSARRTEWPRHGFVVWCLKWKFSRKNRDWWFWPRSDDGRSKHDVLWRVCLGFSLPDRKSVGSTGSIGLCSGRLFCSRGMEGQTDVVQRIYHMDTNATQSLSWLTNIFEWITFNGRKIW